MCIVQRMLVQQEQRNGGRGVNKGKPERRQTNRQDERPKRIVTNCRTKTVSGKDIARKRRDGRERITAYDNKARTRES